MVGGKNTGTKAKPLISKENAQNRPETIQRETVLGVSAFRERIGEQIVPDAEKDLVFFTNGSMPQNSAQGSMAEAPVLNRDTVHKGSFSLWEKLAAKCPEYGHPEKFAFDPDKSSFVSCSVTVRDYPQFFDYLAEKTGNLTGKGSCSTFVDAPWFMNYNVPLQPVAPD